MKFRRFLSISALSASALLLAAGTASAHVSMTGANTVADSYGMMTFNVPHGCEGKPTEKINIKLAEGIVSVTPARSPFWDVEVKMRKLDEPMKGPHGEEITEVPDELIYTTTGEPLPDDRLDQLVISTRWPAEAGALWFPTVQTCPGGAKSSWIQIPKEGEDAHSLESPAPGVVLTEAGDDGHGHDDAKTDHADEDENVDKTAAASSDSSDDDDVEDARRLGMAGIATGVLGMLFGLVGMRRRK